MWMLMFYRHTACLYVYTVSVCPTDVDTMVSFCLVFVFVYLSSFSLFRTACRFISGDYGTHSFILRDRENDEDEIVCFVCVTCSA